MSVLEESPGDLQIPIIGAIGFVAVLAGLELLKHIFGMVRGLLWGGFLGLLWILMIIIPVIGIIILFFTLANWSLNKKGIRVVMLILSVILILVGPVNHTLVRSPFNVFRPVGRIVTERVGDKRVEKIAPYKHTAFDKAVIKVFNLEEKGKKIAKWAKIEYQELPLTED